MNLIVELFESIDDRRNSEFVYCLHENLKSGIFSRICVFVPKTYELAFEHRLLTVVEKDTRATFDDLFNFCNDNFHQENCVVSNNDIIFDKTIGLANDILRQNSSAFIALSRWEYDSEVGFQHFDNFASQDVWIFRTPIQATGSAGFFLGQPGCDNRIARIMADSGCVVGNPSKRIIAKHFHHSRFRIPAGHDKVPGPYLLVHSTDSLGGDWPTERIDDFDANGRPVVYSESLEE